MNRLLRVPGRILMVELAVVGLIVGGLFFLFLSLPLPVWAPAVALWAITIGFLAYRVIVVGGRDVTRMPTETLDAVSIETVDARSTQLLEYDGYGDVVAADMGWQEAVSERVYDTIPMPVEGLTDGVQVDDLRATLFDVPSMAETSDAFDKLRVLTDEDLAAARSDTLLLDAAQRTGETSERAPTLDEETWKRIQQSQKDRDGRASYE